MSASKAGRIKSIGNIAGWMISVMSGVFTLIEVLAPRGINFGNLGLSSDLNYLSNLLSLWYVKYGIVILFIALLLFFVFPREEERVKKRRRVSHSKKKN